MMEDLKILKNFTFIDPVSQYDSYENSGLDELKKECGDITPLNFDYACDAHLFTTNVAEAMSGVCNFSYSLPPFKIFQLHDPKRGQKQLIFYSDDSFGPMNFDADRRNYNAFFSGFKRITLPGCKVESLNMPPSSGNTKGKNYNGVMKYSGNFYAMELQKDAINYNLIIQKIKAEIDPTPQCIWSQVLKSKKARSMTT